MGHKRVLSPGELQLLLSVKTTIKQARDMKRRFTKALKAIRNNEVVTIEEGCPHCSLIAGYYKCGTCAYTEALDKAGINHCCFTPCLKLNFGGVCGEWVSGIGLRYDGIDIDRDADGDTIIFCLGHIEWANAVIRRYEKRKR